MLLQGYSCAYVECSYVILFVFIELHRMVEGAIQYEILCL